MTDFPRHEKIKTGLRRDALQDPTSGSRAEFERFIVLLNGGKLLTFLNDLRDELLRGQVLFQITGDFGETGREVIRTQVISQRGGAVDHLHGLLIIVGVDRGCRFLTAGKEHLQVRIFRGAELLFEPEAATLGEHFQTRRREIMNVCIMKHFAATCEGGRDVRTLDIKLSVIREHAANVFQRPPRRVEVLDHMDQQDQFPTVIAGLFKQIAADHVGQQPLLRIGLKPFARFDAAGGVAVQFEDFDGAADARADFEDFRVRIDDGLELFENAFAVFPGTHHASIRGGHFAVITLAVFGGVVVGQFSVGRNVSVGDEAAGFADDGFQRGAVPIPVSDGFKLGSCTQIALFFCHLIHRYFKPDAYDNSAAPDLNKSLGRSCTDQNGVNTNRRGKSGQDESFQGYFSGGFSEIPGGTQTLTDGRVTTRRRCDSVGRVVLYFRARACTLVTAGLPESPVKFELK